MHELVGATATGIDARVLSRVALVFGEIWLIRQ